MGGDFEPWIAASVPLRPQYKLTGFIAKGLMP